MAINLFIWEPNLESSNIYLTFFLRTKPYDINIPLNATVQSGLPFVCNILPNGI